MICGSAIQSNYQDYNDIDIIIATKKELTSKKKSELLKKIKNSLPSSKLDIQIYSKESIQSQYPHNPSLIYLLKDSKVIYGDIKIPNKIILSSLDLKMKLDWSEDLDISSQPKEIYLALRNSMLVLLLMNKKVDNYLLNNNLANIMGNILLNNLKNNNASPIEKKLAINILNSLNLYLENELTKQKWEKIEI